MVQPGLKNLTDHFLEEWFWRPAAIASYSAGRLAGARSNFVWHGTLSEMGMVVISSTLMVGPVTASLDEEGRPMGDGGAALPNALPALRGRPWSGGRRHPAGSATIGRPLTDRRLPYCVWSSRFLTCRCQRAAYLQWGKRDGYQGVGLC